MGKTQPFTAGFGGDALGHVKVLKGDILQLLVLPKKDHSSDLTRVEWRITEVGGRARKWDLAREVASNVLEDGKGNPHSDALGNEDVWYFYGVPPGDVPLWVAVCSTKKSRRSSAKSLAWDRLSSLELTRRFLPPR